MRVLLISSNRYKKPWPILPYGTLMVAQAVVSAGHVVEVLDTCFSSSPTAAIEGAIGRFRPDVIGVSIRNIDTCAGQGTEFLLDEQKQLTDAIQRAFSGPIVIGGAAVAINAEEMLEYLDLRYALCGDGERIMVEFLDRLNRKEPLAGLPGLVIREGGRITQRKTFAFVEDLDRLEIPNPARFLDPKPYYAFHDAIQVQTKRGCALRCSYCPYPEIEGSTYRYFSPRKLADHVERMVRETGLRRVEIVDSSMNIPLGHFKDVLRELIRRDLGLQMHSMIGLNPGGVDAELVTLMKQAGFHDVGLSIDSASEAVLADLRKNYSKDRMRAAAALLREGGLVVTWYLLMGAPAESLDTIRETFAFVDGVATPWEAVIIAVGVRAYNGAAIAKQIQARTPDLVKDGFLAPYLVEPEKLTLQSTFVLTKLYALYRDNVIVYGDDTTPVFVVRMGFFIVKTFFPGMPIIQMHILQNHMRRWMGQQLLTRILYKLRHRKALRQLGVRRF